MSRLNDPDRFGREDSTELPIGVSTRTNIEILISRLLRAGGLASLVLIVLGTVIGFATHAEYRQSGKIFRSLVGSEAQFPHSVASVFSGLRHLRGDAIVMFGLLLLLATPFFAVATALVGFVREKERPFVVISSVVMTFLIISLLVGKASG